MTKWVTYEGFSVNLALEMIKVAIRDAGIHGLLVRHDINPMQDDDAAKSRHMSWWGEVEAETMRYDVSGECWIQRGEGSTNQNPWKYGQVEFTVDTGMTNGKVARMFYRYDEKSGIEQLRRYDVAIANYIHTGKFSAWFAGQPETTVHGAKSKEEAVGKLLFRFPERFVFVFDERRAG